MDDRYVAVIDMPGGDRLFCSDRFRDEWSGRFGYAETFRALHEAIEVAGRHGGRALAWRDVQPFEAV
ncbi:MAG: hypothetical protein ACYC2H_01070 [Thermoplasmatota archaeon]